MLEGEGGGWDIVDSRWIVGGVGVMKIARGENSDDLDYFEDIRMLLQVK